MKQKPTIYNMVYALFTDGTVRIEVSTTRGNKIIDIVKEFDSVYDALDYLNDNTEVGSREATSMQVDNRGNVTVSSKL